MPTIIDLDKIIPAFNDWLDKIINNPVAAISEAALILLVTIFFSIRKRLGNNLADITDKAVIQITLLGIRLFSNYSFNLRYKKHIIYEHRVFNVRGLQTQGVFALDVEKVYVGLKIAPSANPNKANSITHHEALEGNRPIWDFLNQHLKILAVIGAPGCGKSTLLQHIALVYAANKHRRYGLKAATPIFLFLREHIDKIVTDEINLSDLAQAHFLNEKRYPHLKPPEKWFTNTLENGKGIVLLDGLDEVADVETRKKVSLWVESQIIAYRNCPFIVTSRPQGYLAAPLQQAHRLEIQPFSWSQVKEFAHSWYLQNEILSFGKKDEGVVNKAKQGAEDLLMRLQRMPSLNALTVNPLLLTMIAMVHRYRGQLPGRRVELYSEICNVLLGHWRAAIGLQDNLTAIQKRVALQPLAAEMMQRNTREISTEEALPIISELLKQVGWSEWQAGEKFLKEVESGSGLLAEQEKGLWRFAHLSFQEYLAACHWVEQKLELDWQILVDKSWWHETIRLYAAQSNASKILEACLDVNTVNSLVLASDCLEEAKMLSEPSLRSIVEKRLLTYLESEDIDLRHMAAEVSFKRRLKNLNRINDNVEVDLNFITCAEYQLFLDDEYKNGNYHQPEHWLSYVFAKGDATKPITGMRYESALAFCVWIGKKFNGNYRLPFFNEISSITDNKKLACWCKNKNDEISLTSFQSNNNILNYNFISISHESVGKDGKNFNLLINCFFVVSFLTTIFCVYYSNANSNRVVINAIPLIGVLMSFWVISLVAHALRNNVSAKTRPSRLIGRSIVFIAPTLLFAFLFLILSIPPLESDHYFVLIISLLTAYIIVATLSLFKRNTMAKKMKNNLFLFLIKILDNKYNNNIYLEDYTKYAANKELFGELLDEIKIGDSIKVRTKARQLAILQLKGILTEKNVIKNTIFKETQQQQQQQKLYDSLKIIELRAEGKIPALEGICIVRNQ